MEMSEYMQQLLGKDENIVTMDNLDLDNRSLTFSTVELASPYGIVEYCTGGIPDKYSIEDTDGFHEYAEMFDEETIIAVNIRSYNVGRGKSEYPDEEELDFIKKNENKLKQTYGIDCIQSDGFALFMSRKKNIRRGSIWKRAILSTSNSMTKWWGA